MLEERKITSQQTIFAIIQEGILIFVSSANAMGVKNHCSVHHPHPPFPTNILMVFRSSWHFCGFMLDSQGQWKHGGG